MDSAGLWLVLSPVIKALPLKPQEWSAEYTAGNSSPNAAKRSETTNNGNRVWWMDDMWHGTLVKNNNNNKAVNGRGRQWEILSMHCSCYLWTWKQLLKGMIIIMIVRSITGSNKVLAMVYVCVWLCLRGVSSCFTFSRITWHLPATYSTHTQNQCNIYVQQTNLGEPTCTIPVSIFLNSPSTKYKRKTIVIHGLKNCFWCIVHSAFCIVLKIKRDFYTNDVTKHTDKNNVFLYCIQYNVNIVLQCISKQVSNLFCYCSVIVLSRCCRQNYVLLFGGTLLSWRSLNKMKNKFRLHGF